MSQAYAIVSLREGTPKGQFSGLGEHFICAFLGPISKDALLRVPSSNLIWANSEAELRNAADSKFPGAIVKLSWSEFRNTTRNYWQDHEAAKLIGAQSLGVNLIDLAGMFLALDMKILTETTTPEEAIQAAKHGPVLTKNNPALFKIIKRTRGIVASRIDWHSTYFKLEYNIEEWNRQHKESTERKHLKDAITLNSTDSSAQLVHNLRSQMAKGLRGALIRRALGKIKANAVRIEVSNHMSTAGIAAREVETLFELGKKLFGPKFWDGKINKYKTISYGPWDPDAKDYKQIDKGPILKQIREYQIIKHAKYPAKQYKAARALWNLVWRDYPDKLKKLKSGIRANKL